MIKSLVEIITAINIVITGHSFHSDPNTFNQNNHLQGVELEVENKGAYYKSCTNSFGKRSDTIGIFYKKCTDGKLRLCSGASGGLATGYETPLNDIMPYITLDAGIENKYLGVSVNCIPSFSACMYQLKLRKEF